MTQIDEQTIQRIRERTMLGTLEVEVVEASGERVVLRMPVTPRVHQPAGLLHGGASVALAETGASLGAWLAAGEGYDTVGVEINANHLRSVRDGHVTSVSVPVRQGRTIAVWDTRITDAQERLVCVSRCTVAVRPSAD
jgi:uncharacterized protein (TIGR00369 family)